MAETRKAIFDRGNSREVEFEQLALVHIRALLRAAVRLARDASVAEDLVQDAMLRALTYFRTFKGTDARAWTLQIVRNSAYAALRKKYGWQVSLFTLGARIAGTARQRVYIEIAF